MHKSAMHFGKLFIESYFLPGMKSILEIGSYDVNGSLRSYKPIDAEWIGVDIDDGPGVDIVVSSGSKLPFPDNSFDVVVASSVFEHDLAFWKTLSEMTRVVKNSGFLYVNAPSNGLVHRYPLDCFRFYPDACQSFLEIIRESEPRAVLVESFVAEQDEGQIWSDYVSIFAMSKDAIPSLDRIYKTEKCTNVWDGDLFLQETLVEHPEDRRIAEKILSDLSETRKQFEESTKIITSHRDALVEERDALVEERDALVEERDAILQTKTFRWTKGLRDIVARIRSS
jgi:ubiquinone/menaquinone biosynthesis C-methylase UbiE